MESKRGRPPKVDENGNVHFLENDVDPLCDFCCIPEAEPVVTLLLETVRNKPPNNPTNLVSEGGWYACRPCLDFILAHEYENLLRRSWLHFVSRPKYRSCTITELLEIKRDLKIIHNMALQQLLDWP